MPRFLIHAIAGTLGAGIFYCVMPMFMAMGLNALWPFGLDALTATTEIKVFGAACVIVLLPMTAVVIVRSSRRMFFSATDGRPALFGRARGGLAAERGYKTRALLSLTAAFFSAAAAAAIAAYSAHQSTTGFAIPVLFLCLFTVAAGLAAIELNDLRRTVRLTLYAQ